MELNLNRPLAFFDLETTGIDVVKDRIVEIAILKVHPNQKREQLYYKINPTIPIPIQASEVHGIYDKDVASCPKFKEVAKEIFDFIADSDLAGFNSNKFDVPLLIEEMLRCDLDIEVENKKNVDVQVIFHKMEKRTLEAAYKFYCNKDLVNAHSALADTEATMEVLQSQLDRYPEIENNIDFISTNFGSYTDHLDSGKRFLKTPKGVVLCFGKHKDKTLEQIAKEDSGYFKWMYGADFGLHSKQILKKLCLERGIRFE